MGIEVWTTTLGAERLETLLQGDAWEALELATSPLPKPVIHVFELDGRRLEDVTSAEEATCANATLHDRLQALRTELPPTIELLGCLAGGRKTISAALQTAFSLQAGANARLVHAIIDRRLEAHLRQTRTFQHYAFPTLQWEQASGVPVDEQIVVHEVPFPRVRLLAHGELREHLASSGWHEVWATLEANRHRTVAGTLRPEGGKWRLVLADSETDQVLVDEPLAARRGAVLAAMASGTPTTSARDVLDWLDAHPKAGWTPPDGRGSDMETRLRAVTNAKSKLSSELRRLLPAGLERFSPDSGTYFVPDVTVEFSSGTGA